MKAFEHDKWLDLNYVRHIISVTGDPSQCNCMYELYRTFGFPSCNSRHMIHMIQPMSMFNSFMPILIINIQTLHCQSEQSLGLPQQYSLFHMEEYRILNHIHRYSCNRTVSFANTVQEHYNSLHLYHDDVIKWKHFPRYWPFVRGIDRSPVNSPHKSQWRGALMFALICAVKKRLSKHSWGWWFETHRAHYDVIIIINPSIYSRERSKQCWLEILWISNIHSLISNWWHVLAVILKNYSWKKL